MRFVATALFFLATLTSSAFAQEVYGNEAGCARYRGEPVLTDDVYVFDLQSVERHESSCPIANAKQVGGGVTLLTVMCSGEGSTWEDFYMVETTAEAEKLMIYPEGSPEYRTEMMLCE